MRVDLVQERRGGPAGQGAGAPVAHGPAGARDRAPAGAAAAGGAVRRVAAAAGRARLRYRPRALIVRLA